MCRNYNAKVRSLTRWIVIDYNTTIHNYLNDFKVVTNDDTIKTVFIGRQEIIVRELYNQASSTVVSHVYNYLIYSNYLVFSSLTCN